LNKFRVLSLTTTLGSRYWRLQEAIINGSKNYRYFAYGMHDRMDTPPDYCYVCNSAVFVRYEKTEKLQGGYNFSDKFFLTNFQVFFCITNLLKRKRRNLVF